MRAELEALLHLMDEAFEGHMSLIQSLDDVRDEDWWATPPGGRRSIASILEHVGWAKWMYENYGFGDASLRGDLPPMWPADSRPRPRPELLAWLREGHSRMRASVGALEDDSALERPRFVYGRQRDGPTREIVTIMIAHDFYHAGEINHLRAVLQGNDSWPY
jgi:uncharacterized damage-inducible protein DinB